MNRVALYDFNGHINELAETLKKIVDKNTFF